MSKKKQNEILQGWKPLLGPKHWLSWLSLVILAILAWIPNRIRDLICYLLSFPCAALNIKFKRISLVNLRLVFPEKSEQELQQLYRKSMLHALITLFAYGADIEC